MISRTRRSIDLEAHHDLRWMPQVWTQRPRLPQLDRVGRPAIPDGIMGTRMTLVDSGLAGVVPRHVLPDRLSQFGSPECLVARPCRQDYRVKWVEGDALDTDFLKQIPDLLYREHE